MNITWDSRSLVVDGRRELLISGEVHYARSPRALWPALLDRSAACGLNGIASYVFWNWHEPRRDVFDFTGDRDLGHFLHLCRERNLFVFLRAGPYCCAEWNFGGYPPYLRDEPGIAIRTWNAPYRRRVERYLRRLADEFLPHLATRGGPVVLVQVENEYALVAKRYGAAGRRYLAWMADLARDLGVDVPIVMCEGAAPGVIETVNGHAIPDARAAAFRQQHPDLPMLWTELWPAWYDTWGRQHHRRDPRNIAYHLLRFLAQGGSGFNYYMWHGGTNFGRTSMYLQTTSYDFDAPLDEFGRPRLSASYLRDLHLVLREHAPLLLGGTRTAEKHRDGAVVTAWRQRGQELTLHDRLAGGTAVLRDGRGRILFDTAASWVRARRAFRPRRWRALAPFADWRCWQEPLPPARGDAPIRRAQPVDQLALTRDASDYCWYSTTIDVSRPGIHTLDIPFGGDFFYVHLDGRLVAQSQPPLAEIRGPTMPDDPHRPRIIAYDLEMQNPHGFRHRFRFAATRGQHRLDILACALGLVKGDWQIADSMHTERKGIWQPVALDGRRLRGWEMRPLLAGETLGLAANADAGCWSRAGRPRRYTWYAAAFDVAAEALRTDHDYRLDASGLGKGMLFLNGQALGRHWLLPANGYGPDASWHNFARDALFAGPNGKPTQRYYHVPRAWLQKHNRLVIFEEQAHGPRAIRLQVR